MNGFYDMISIIFMVIALIGIIRTFYKELGGGK